MEKLVAFVEHFKYTQYKQKYTYNDYKTTRLEKNKHTTVESSDVYWY